MILAVDPGVKACGMAWFTDDGKLYRAEYLPAACCTSGGIPTELVIEMPRIYPGSGQQKGDLNDLLNLAMIVGQVVSWANAPTSRIVYPAQWKGQVPKKVMTNRILTKLSVEESAAIVRVGAKDHNTIDAVGIGLWHFGRLQCSSK